MTPYPRYVQAACLNIRSVMARAADSSPGAEAATPLRPHVGQHPESHDRLPPPARVRLDRLHDHAARERGNGVEPRAGRLVPRDLVLHLEAEGQRGREVDHPAAVGSRLVRTGGVLAEVVARGRVGPAATAAADLRELARAATAAELGVAQL